MTDAKMVARAPVFFFRCCVAYFHEWAFPIGQLPKHWLQLASEFGSNTVRRMFPPSDIPAVLLQRKSSCRLINHHDAAEIANLVFQP
jgi:hypothetical protein